MGSLTDNVALTRYDWGGRNNEPLAFPCHDVCMHAILPKALSCVSNEAESTIDVEALWRTMKSLGTSSDKNHATYLDRLDYGEHMEDLHHQYWYLHSGVEYYMANPAFVPALEKYYSNLPVMNSQEDTELSVPPAESGSAHWRERVQSDMPWLYDLPQLHAREDAIIDWAQVYTDLVDKGRNESDARILGLVNRKRIWKLCEQIASLYNDVKQAKDSEGESDILQDAFSGPTVSLGKLHGVKSETSRLVFVDDLKDVGKGNTIFTVHWNEAGYLLAFGVNSSGTSEYARPSNSGAVRVDEVRIAENDWLRGFVFTTRSAPECTLDDGKEKRPARVVIGVELLLNRGKPVKLGAAEGDKRLVCTGLDEVLIGLQAEWTHTSGILEVALLKCRENGSSQGPLPYTDSTLDQILWKSELPPAQVDISPPMIGYWSHGFSTQLHPHEVVLFGQNAEELSTLTSVSFDVQFGGIELGYSGGVRKSIGPRPWAMKTLEIDGPGGERIAGVFGNKSNIPDGLRLVTNRNRQLLLGNNLSTERQHILHSSDTNFLYGLYCGWTGNASSQSRLDSLGALLCPKHLPASKDESQASGLQDQNGMWWEPNAPPQQWKESGPLHGQCDRKVRWGRVGTMPCQWDIESWLDMTRAVEEVNVTFTHGNRMYPMGMYLVSIRLLYSGGTQSTVGPDRFLDSPDSNGEGGMPWCWCHLGPTDKKELASFAHYHHDTFRIYGDYIQCLHIWTEDSALSGFQFVTSAGLEGPKWGKCEGNAEVTIEFSQENDERRAGKGAVGLKIATTDNKRPTTYSDRIVAGFQALVKGESI